MRSGDITGVTGVPVLTWCYDHNRAPEPSRSMPHAYSLLSRWCSFSLLIPQRCTPCGSNHGRMGHPCGMGDELRLADPMTESMQREGELA